jgi:hypothetical protein
MFLNDIVNDCAANVGGELLIATGEVTKTGKMKEKKIAGNPGMEAPIVGKDGKKAFAKFLQDEDTSLSTVKQVTARAEGVASVKVVSFHPGKLAEKIGGIAEKDNGKANGKGKETGDRGIGEALAGKATNT